MTEPSAPARGVVLGGTGGVWRVRTEGGDTLDASLRGRLKNADNDTLKLAVGDDVRLEPSARGASGTGDWAIAEILPRRSQLARRAPSGAYGERIVAANVDQVVVVFAAAKPEPHPRMLDRFLVIAESNGLAARLVINKVDLVGETAARERFQDYDRAGYPVHLTAAKTGLGLDAVRAALDGRRSVLTGPSGVGKSSMLNALFPGAKLRVGAISESVNKGRHTTVGAVMLPLPGADGGYVIDTPGLREVGLWALPPEALDRCFPEMRALRDACRFADCAHVVEPDCAVRAALARGEISAPRYDSYLKLLDEARQG
jgi:ribosome biogenesis GTPase